MNAQKKCSLIPKIHLAVDPEMPAAEAIILMRRNKISCLPVVQDGSPVGIITERDLVWTANQILNFPQMEVREVMSTPVMTADCDIKACDAYALFLEHHIRHLVLMTSEGDLAGVVTQSDILNHHGFSGYREGHQISRIMSRDVTVLSKEHSARQALTRMTEQSISCIVIAEEGRPLGVFSEGDVTRLIIQGKESWAARLEEVMSCPAQTIAADAPILQGVERMNENNIRRLVVVNDEGKIEGLVTQTDLLKVLQVPCELRREAAAARV
jgi:predicted transcriptional regulator